MKKVSNFSIQYHCQFSATTAYVQAYYCLDPTFLYKLPLQMYDQHDDSFTRELRRHVQKQFQQNPWTSSEEPTQYPHHCFTAYPE